MPFRIFPRMLTLPVKGHFLSTKWPSFASLGVWKDKPTLRQYRMARLPVFLPSSRFEPMKTA
eukprot:CAMPEP_0168386514 /NCGR_PEP_ID=MMETSP0228-20121227/15467_1 /TAXON_ID=133427 /ORGANISM="Protoceratium reticulatum, Strain CCCM 535 (=CCMP 1889)" /LENGTH=61 /DNA_ID=CAMNT_0008399717 /DNA_START=68 /DNA_END=249 /DNA_ORIENTATION=-